MKDQEFDGRRCREIRKALEGTKEAIKRNTHERKLIERDLRNARRMRDQKFNQVNSILNNLALPASIIAAIIELLKQGTPLQRAIDSAGKSLGALDISNAVQTSSLEGQLDSLNRDIEVLEERILSNRNYHTKKEGVLRALSQEGRKLNCVLPHP